MGSLRGKVAVVGVGESTYYKRGEATDLEFVLTLKAIMTACTDAGISPKDVDGFASYSNDRKEPSRLAAALGCKELTFSNMQWGGGGLRWRDGPNESFIVLDQQLSRAPFGEPAKTFQVGTHHWGLWVDDVDAMVACAEAAGVSIAVRPVSADSVAYGEPAGGTVRSAFLRDPDGNIVQLDGRA